MISGPVVIALATISSLSRPLPEARSFDAVVPGDDEIVRCAVTGGGDRIVGIGRDGGVRLFDDRLELVAELAPRLRSRALDAKFSPDAESLVVVGKDARVYFWDLERVGRGELEAVAVRRPAGARWFDDDLRGGAAWWSSDSSRVMVLNGSMARRLYDGRGGLVANLDAVGWEERGYDALWHEASRSVLLREAGGVSMYDWTTGERRASADGSATFATPQPPTAFAISPDGSRLVVAWKRLGLRSFDVASRRALVDTRYRPDDLFRPVEGDNVLCMVHSPGGTRLAVSTRSGSHVAVLDPETLAVEYDSGYRGHYRYGVYRLTWWPDGGRLLCHFDDGYGGVSELTLGDEPSWQDYERLTRPVLSWTKGFGLLDGEIASWELFTKRR